MSAPLIPDPASGDGLRVVFFGPPGAGKTALLAVLGLAQEQQLQGRLTDVSRGLSGLRTAVGKPSPDLAAYPVTFQPLPGPRGGSQPSAEAILIDCPGQAAADLLAKPWEPGDHAPEGLAGAVLRADTLVLPLDASATPEQIEAYFESFGIFLRELEVHRGRRLEAAGLPVFLVLTKCDLLARAGDTTMDWMERIEERKREVDLQFRAYLSRGGEEIQPPAFGAIEVHCWATAARRPTLAGAAKSRESYGVAELFRQCLQEAAAYRRRQRRSGRRLKWTAVAAAAGVVLLGSVTAVQLLQSDRVRSDLELKVENLHLSDQEKAADRLNARPPELVKRVERFQKLREDPGFDALPAGERAFVHDRLSELLDYLALREKVPPPRVLMELRSLDALRKLRDDLKELSAPAEWTDTEGVRQLEERRADLNALGDAVLKAQDSYRTDTDVAGKLLGSEDIGTAWLEDARNLLTPDAKSALVPTARIPGSSTLTYSTALAFTEVTADRLAWENRRRDLVRARDLIAALGLAGPGVEPPPVLAIREGTTLDDARQQAALLKKHYPRSATDFALDALKSPRVRQRVTREARHFYENLLRPARELVARQGAASEDWDRVRTWLRGTRELEDWAALAKALTPLVGAPVRDPVEELEGFLQVRSFPLRPVRLVLEVPENSVDRLDPPATAVLTLEYTPRGGEKATISFARDNTKTERDRDNRVTRYFFNRTSGRDQLYEPGGELLAAVHAKDDCRLTWKNPQASTVYQIERLVLPPLRHRDNQSVSEGEVERGVRLLCADPPDGLPRLPDLLQKPAR